MIPPGATRRALQAAVATGCAIAFLASGALICPVALVAHRPCPACGLTRASLALLRLDFADAISLHPLVFVVTPLLALYAATAAHAYVTTGRALPAPRFERMFAIALPVTFVAMLALWIARFFGAFGGPVSVG